MPVGIVFGAINVNSYDTQSFVTIGENSQNSYDANSKNEYADGFFLGLTTNFANINVLNDLSIINAPINDQDFKPIAEIQA
ncbi:MAG: hypothetical protein M0Z41_01205 [Peptococcaceae bacterium]|nr:hypothetical protein [Peptococcaceae bacterium]